MKTKIPWYTSTATIIISVTFAIIWIGIPAITFSTASQAQVNIQTDVSDYDPQIAGLATVTYNDGYETMKVTGFSSYECKTTWCRANAGKPRGRQVALNAKYGKYSQVYIPAYDKTYDVIGTTDYKTDLDIWFGDEYDTALAQGTKYLEVKLIK